MDSSKKRWFSDNEEILTIDAVSGVAHALKVGRPSIYLKDMVNFMSAVNISKVNKAMLSADYSKVLTNISENHYYQEKYEIPIKFYSNDKEVTNFNSEKSHINNNLALSCHLQEELSDLFEVTSVIKDKSGDTDSSQDQNSDVEQEAFCVVFIKKEYPLNMRFPENIILTTKLYSKDITEFSYEYDFHFKMLWAFQNLSNSKMVNLTRSSRKHEISV